MKSYAQFCPVAKAADIFCERWTALIIRDLAWGATRFSELQRGVPLMSPTLLSQRLKRLEREGIVKVDKRPGERGRHYRLTAMGEDFVPVIDALGVWGQRWSRRELEDDEVDLGLLLWSIERRAAPDAFERSPAVVQLTFTDQPDGFENWWFLNEEGACEVCRDDPGFGVDIYLTVSLPDMIRIVRGDIAIPAALDQGALEAHGSATARRALAGWLNLSPLAAIPSRRN
ncbi:winged helix-turn-helix transcriptional regulator [Cucumibacter marinus]|uniref:winged helix-turn-helix transcriptional regulator n=1 Tax=Cucumibacter marinus TaxID=1121252 RepID=UPI0003F5F0C6|nr:helix-turn-helix domain-containing protein [Cucumibacter marinus]